MQRPELARICPPISSFNRRLTCAERPFVQVRYTSAIDPDLPFIDSNIRMNQKLSDWASIAEVVSGAAVVITLIMLLIGIRENTITTRAAEYSSLLDSINELESNRLHDAELMLLWRAFARGETFDRENPGHERFRLYLQMLGRNYEKAYYQYTSGVIGQTEWERFLFPICFIHVANQEQGLESILDSPAYSPNFRAFVRDACTD